MSKKSYRVYSAESIQPFWAAHENVILYTSVKRLLSVLLS